MSWRPRDRAAVTRLVACLAFIAGLLLAHPLYLSRTFYPASPVSEALPAIPAPLDHVLLAALLACLAAAAFTPWFPALAVAAVALALGLAAWDQSRWQPWFYQYVVMLAALVPRPAGRQGDGLDACRLVVASLYLWSGLQKVNVTFAHIVFPWLVQPLTDTLPSALAGALPAAGLAAAVVEAGIGVGLLTRRFRQVAVMTAVAMHAVLLLLLGPLGHATNAVIWPWNVAMAVLAVVLFWGVDAGARRILWPARPGVHAVVAVLALLVPLLGLAGLVDAYLSGALYSGNIEEAAILVSPALKDRLPGEIRRHVTTNRAGLDVLVIADWSLGELGVPPYPEARVYRTVARAVCAYAAAPSEAELIIFGRPGPWSGVRDTTRADCAALGRR